MNQIIYKQSDGYNLFIKNDGTDYERIWKLFLGHKLDKIKKVRQRDTRCSFHAEHEGRQFLIKVDWKKAVHLDRKLWRLIRGPLYPRKMREVLKAIRKGCTLTQEIFFVAEKQHSLFNPHTCIILDYLPGVNLESLPDREKYYPEVGRALAELHRYDLALGDISNDNYLLTEEGIKVIDLSYDGFAWAGKGKDVVLARQVGIEVPLNSFAEWLTVRYTVLKYLPRKLKQALRGR